MPLIKSIVKTLFFLEMTPIKTKTSIHINLVVMLIINPTNHYCYLILKKNCAVDHALDPIHIRKMRKNTQQKNHK